MRVVTEEQRKEAVAKLKEELKTLKYVEAAKKFGIGKSTIPTLLKGKLKGMTEIIYGKIMNSSNEEIPPSKINVYPELVVQLKKKVGSQHEAAREMGISQTLLSVMLRGKQKNVSRQNMERIEKWVGLESSAQQVKNFVASERPQLSPEAAAAAQEAYRRGRRDERRNQEIEQRIASLKAEQKELQSGVIA